MEEIFEAMMTANFPQINARHQTTDPGSPDDTPKTKPWACHIQTSENQRLRKNKQKTLKEAREENSLPREEQ